MSKRTEKVIDLITLDCCPSKSVEIDKLTKELPKPDFKTTNSISTETSCDLPKLKRHGEIYHR